MGSIYVFTFPNGKQYVGQTVNVKARYSRHKHGGRRMVVSDAIKKYGWGNIKRQEMSCPKELLDWMEREWIKELNCLSPTGYNVETGGYYAGRCLSAQTRKKISEAGMGRRFSDEHKRKLSESGKGKHEGARNGMFGKKRPAHSLRMTGAGNPMYGRTHSDEAKKKISERVRRVPLRPT
jgi:group I intron endonuclease